MEGPDLRLVLLLSWAEYVNQYLQLSMDMWQLILTTLHGHVAINTYNSPWTCGNSVHQKDKVRTSWSRRAEV